METAGLVIRMPANWRMNRPSRPSVEATVGATQPSVLGMDGLLDFRVEVSLDGETLTDAEIEALLAATHGLALLRGKWVEVDQQRLRETLDKFQADRAPLGTGGRSLRRGHAAAGRRRVRPRRQIRRHGGMGTCPGRRLARRGAGELPQPRRPGADRSWRRL